MADPSDLRIAVLQPGARLHYAVPTLLQRAGLLHCLYTDCTNIGLLRHIERLWPRRLQPPPVRRLLGRKLSSEVPASKVRQVWPAVLRGRLLSTVSGRRGGRSSQALLKRALNERFGGANAIYTVLVNEDLEACRIAKMQGCRIIHEVMLTPDAGLLTHDEYRRYPMSSTAPSLHEIEAGRDRDRQKYALADLILVPSLFVRDAVLSLGAEPAKVAVVPYGIDRSWLNAASHPVRGRVLFVGSVGLRKGNHYLAEAARDLAARGVDCDIRVVGPWEIGVAKNPLFAGPTYLDQIPRTDIQSEYSSADIFVLPSLAEGMAVVTLEAMAAGLPVITTPNAGSCVRHEIDGLIVPARDAHALASAIEHILSDRVLRDTMSRNAKLRAAEFTWERYEGRLIDALARISAPPPLGRASDLMVSEHR